MTDDNFEKAREFWIIPETQFSTFDASGTVRSTAPSNEDIEYFKNEEKAEFIHVIEKAAYDELKAYIKTTIPEPIVAELVAALEWYEDGMPFSDKFGNEQTVAHEALTNYREWKKSNEGI
jgi:uncharacterized metal-binding protein